MRQKITLDIIMSDRSHHRQFVTVEAKSGNEGADFAQDAIKTTPFYKQHVSRIVATHVVGIEPDPLPPAYSLKDEITGLDIARLLLDDTANIHVSDSFTIRDVTPEPIKKRKAIAAPK